MQTVLTSNSILTSIAEEKQILNGKIREAESAGMQVIRSADLAETWRNTAYDERKTVCRLLIHRIRIAKDGSVEVIWNF